jgi:hypothetical protein
VKYASNGLDRIQFTYTDRQPRQHDEQRLLRELFNGALYNPTHADQEPRRRPIALRDGADLRQGPPTRSAPATTPGSGRRARQSQPAGVAFTSLFSARTTPYSLGPLEWHGWDDRTLVPNAGGTIGAATRKLRRLGAGPARPAHVYVSRWVGKTLELEQWRTTDDGKTWSSFPITKGTATKDVRPIVPRESPGRHRNGASG